MIDSKAKKILFNTFWNKGWIDRNQRATAPDDFAYAKAKGLMFEPLTIGHDELIFRITELVTSIPATAPAQAFLASLSTRRLDWRSVLASWCYGRSLAPHGYQEQVRISGHFYEDGIAIPVETVECTRCGGRACYREEDLNLLNFERLRWGGVRLGDLIYVLLDLQQFSSLDMPQPTAADLAIWGNILTTIATSAPHDSPGTLRTRLKGVLRSNQQELGGLLESLAYCGILKAGSDERRDVGGHHDWMYAAAWRGEDGYCKNAVEDLFAGVVSAA